MALNLVTRAEYKAYAGISSTNQDAIIDLLIPRISKLVKNYCRRSFVDYWDTPLVEIFNGDVPYFVLKETPLLDVSSVEISTDYGQTYTVLTKYTDWAVDGDLVVPIGVDIFPKYVAGYKVTYTAGYEDVPEDLALAVFDLISYYRKNDGAVNAIKRTDTTTMQIEYISDTSLPSHIRRVLDLYIADYT